MNIFRRWIDRCYNVDCTRSRPTCSSRFRRGLSTPSCLSPQQIVPPNSSLKSAYIEKQYPVFLHTKFKNYVYILKMSKWVKTKQYSASPFVVNINVTAKTWGLLVLVCDHWYRNFFNQDRLISIEMVTFAMVNLDYSFFNHFADHD